MKTRSRRKRRRLEDSDTSSSREGNEEEEEATTNKARKMMEHDENSSNNSEEEEEEEDVLELDHDIDFDEEQEEEQVKKPEKPKQLTLTERLNQRSRPPVPSTSSSSGRTKITFSPPSTPPAARQAAPSTSSLEFSPSATPEKASTPVRRLPLRQRLNLRSRPVLPPEPHHHVQEQQESETFHGFRTPPSSSSRPRPDPNRTPEHHAMGTPPPCMDKDEPDGEDSLDGDGELDASFAASVTFSPNVSQNLNSSMISEGGPGFSSDEDEDTGLGGDADRREAVLDAKVSQLDTARVDQLVAAEEEDQCEEPMDWDDVDPGLLEELHKNRECVKDGKDDGKDGTLTSLALPKTHSRYEQVIMLYALQYNHLGSL